MLTIERISHRVMAPESDDEAAGGWAPSELAARVAAAESRARAELDAAVADTGLADSYRLDERTRLALGESLRSMVATVEAAIRRHATRLLADRAAPGGTVLRSSEEAIARLMRAGLLRERSLLADVIARVREDLIAETLPVAVTGPDEPSLLVRLSAAPDALVARAALALLAADSRRRDARDRGEMQVDDLSVDLHRRLVWHVAAALRSDDADPVVDRALSEAAVRCLSAHDDHERGDSVALRLAAAIDPRPAEIASLLVEAIGDRRLGFFIALLAQTLSLPIEQIRTLTIDPVGDRLWIALRALGLDRTAIARIGLALADADARRDVEAFAQQIDLIARISVDQAAAALVPLALPAEYHAAIRTVDRWTTR